MVLGPGGPNERPTVTLIGKRLPGKTWFVLRVNFLRILQRTFPRPVQMHGTSSCALVHVMVSFFSFSFCAPRGSQVVWHNSTLSAHVARTPPTSMSVTMARNESMTLCFVRIGLSCPATEFDCEGLTFGLTFGPRAGSSLPLMLPCPQRAEPHRELLTARQRRLADYAGCFAYLKNAVRNHCLALSSRI